jgi:hypothetical protein
VRVQVDSSAAPLWDGTTLAVTAGGTVTWLTGASLPRFATIDSTGRVIASWGRIGDGPGETRTGWLLSGDTTVTLVSTSPPAVLVFSPRGKLLSDQRAGQPQGGFPETVVGDSVDRSFSDRLVGKTHVLDDVQGPVTRACEYSACSRVLLPASDSVLRHVQLAAPRKDGDRWPPYAAEPGRFVLGDGVNYRLWMFDDHGHVLYQFGRNVPRRQLTKSELAAAEAGWDNEHQADPAFDVGAARQYATHEVLPHFGYLGIAFDGEHRLWVIGKANDSTFADVFADSTFLGRHMIDCTRGRTPAAVRGRWLALLCNDSLNDVMPYRVRLFRIMDSPAATP